MQYRPPPWSPGHEDGTEINVEPEVEFRPEIEFLPEGEIPAQTDEGVSGATRHLTDIASQEVEISQEATTSTSITTSTPPTINPRQRTSPHTGSLPLGNLPPAGRSVTSPVISGTETPIPTLSYYGNLPIVDSASRAHASVSDFAIPPHGEVAMHGDMAITSRGDIAIFPPGDTSFVPLIRRRGTRLSR